MRPTVLVPLNYYLPGYKSGGPIRTIANMVQQLGERFDFRVVAQDRDATDTAPYAGVAVNAWQPVGRAQVWYAGPGRLGLSDIRALTREVQPDLIYLNSFFAAPAVRYLALRRLRLVPPIPVLIAPRGEFAPSALAQKANKKRPFMRAAFAAGLYRDLRWQASAEPELADIRRVLGPGANAQIAPDFPPQLDVDTGALPPPKRPGALRAVFLARVTPMKNLVGAIELLRGVQGEIVLDIYGPIRDEAYWAQCQAAIASAPANVRVTYRGGVAHDQVLTTLSQYHVSLLPTLGENFGHSILESLAAGCVPLISDRTPWRDLAADGAGWDLPLEAPEQWRAALQQCVDLDRTALAQHALAARRKAQAFIQSPQTAQQMAALLESAIGAPSPRPERPPLSRARERG